jgi:T4 RnlA family RNA ligase
MTPVLQNYYIDYENGILKDNIKIKQETVAGKVFNIVSYIYNNNDTFNDPLLLESRGITFEEDGKIVSRPFEKFFGLDGSQWTLSKDLDFTDAEFYLKVDGSMITFVPIDGQIYAKTKKSFFSDVAISCQNDFGNNELLKHLITSFPNLTFIFEYTSPSNRVVIDYGKTPELTLLAVRGNITGEYIPIGMYSFYNILHSDWKNSNINFVKKYDNLTIFDAINETHNEDSDIEGFVAVLKTGQRVKLKCDPYLAKHRVLDEFNAKNLATLIAKDLHDDLKPVLSPERKNILENLEKIILKELEIYSQVVYNLVSEWEGKSLREIGTNYGKHPQFNPAINIFKQLGDNDDIIVQHYLKHRVENFSTKPLW